MISLKTSMPSVRVKTLISLCLVLLAGLLGTASPAAVAATKPAAHKPAKPVKRSASKPRKRCRATKHHHCPKPKPKRKPSTAAQVVPVAQTGAAQTSMGTSANLSATINPKGKTTYYWFQYGTTAGYGTQTQAISVGNGTKPVQVSATVAGVAAMTAYHFRVVASNCGNCHAGTVYGADGSFALGGFLNPVWGATEAADPAVLDVGGQHSDYWAFTTGNLFPLLHSSDLVHWTPAGTAMTGLPSWVVQSGDWHPWAPTVVPSPASCPGSSTAGCYVMFYVGLSSQFGANCVAVATSPTPGGPYSDQGPLSNGNLDAAGRPIGCGDNNGYGMIDPSPFVDPSTGQIYLYASEDFSCGTGNASCTGANSHLAPTISVIPLSPDFRHATGPRTPLFAGAGGTWESAGAAVPTVEGPFGLLHNGLYYVIYSGGSWRGAYGMGYATSSSPTGPFVKAAANPFLAQGSGVLSPGGGDHPVTGPHGGAWVLYHGRVGSYATARAMRLDAFTWRPQGDAPDAPAVLGPSSVAQPVVP